MGSVLKERLVTHFNGTGGEPRGRLAPRLPCAAAPLGPLLLSLDLECLPRGLAVGQGPRLPAVEREGLTRWHFLLQTF